MRNFLLIILVILTVNISSAQENPGVILTLDFAPSFLSPSQLIIEESSDSASIKITIKRKYEIKQNKATIGVGKLKMLITLSQRLQIPSQPRRRERRHCSKRYVSSKQFNEQVCILVAR